MNAAHSEQKSVSGELKPQITGREITRTDAVPSAKTAACIPIIIINKSPTGKTNVHAEPIIGAAGTSASFVSRRARTRMNEWMNGHARRDAECLFHGGSLWLKLDHDAPAHYPITMI